MNYGYITGEFDIDTSNDEMFEIERKNDSNEIEQFLCIETARDLTGLNFVKIGDASAFVNWRDQNE